MKGSSNDNGKISDSGNTNSCVSQSQRSSGSSLSRRNTNQSESSGYCGGHPLTCDSSNYALPQPISRHNQKEHKKKKSKTSTTKNIGNVGTEFRSQINSEKQNDVGTYDSYGTSSDFATNSKKAEIADVELADDTGLGDHNGDSNSTELERGIGTITNPLEDSTSNINATFSVVISMKKGLVVDVTPSLSTILGHTRESWINRSFIEFVHPKDKQAFADHLAKNISLPYEDHDKGLDGHRTSIFCSLQKNKERRSTVGSASDESSYHATTSNPYLPFHLITSTKAFRDPASEEKLQMFFLIVNAEPIMPIYQAPEEMIISTIFSTRHDSNCILINVEVDVVQYFGYMPHEMIGRSVFDFYHPDDLPYLKEVYETVVKMDGLPFRSKPYRFATQNSDYVVLETEWSAFFNPWSEKLEFVVGHHRVLRGPKNPNVFQAAPDPRKISSLENISEEIFKESKIIQSEIQAVLNEKIERMEDDGAYEITSSSKNLDTFVENLLREVKPPAPVSKEHFATDHKSFLGSRNPLLQEHDSAILGAISPHDRYCDSKSSTETPPSYGQLNYNEKITRYFDSKLLVSATYGDGDNTNLSVPSNKEVRKSSSNLTGTKNTTLSGENLSSGSNNRTSYDSPDDVDKPRSVNPMPTGDLEIPTLTESMLNKHNREMEKLLIQQHKEWRRNLKYRKEDKDSKNNGTEDNQTRPSNKRSKHQTKTCSTKKRRIDDHEGEQCKIPKCDEDAKTGTVAPVLAATNASVHAGDKVAPETAATQDSNVWPPATGAASPQLSHPHFYVAASNNEPRMESRGPEFSSLVPLFYVPLPRTVPSTTNSQPQQVTYVSYATAPLAGVIYPPVVCAPAPVTTMYRPFLIPGSVPINREIQQTNSANAQEENSSKSIKRPASHATSIKGEVGSTMALSESSKKQLFLGDQFSSCISIDGLCSSLVPNTKPETSTNSQFNSSLEDSSDSSFYSSFLTKSNQSSYDRSENIVPHHPQKIRIRKQQLNLPSRGPPWQEDVMMTDQLIYRYQLTPKPLNEVLEADMKILRNLDQPSMVTDQLAQMYSDMELSKVDFSAKLIPCEHDTPVGSEGGSSGEKQRNVALEVRKCESSCSVGRQDENVVSNFVGFSPIRAVVCFENEPKRHTVFCKIREP
ncbi:period circadian protein isoform X2 [Venturia canescens]|uniref:period circadian protein isoform X2 n=1 Tax=Venturia canescens TaxID=32260 RepID=UPI001C9D48A0|nr:period circadian protein isoform X2 [Venturia canescens]